MTQKQYMDISRAVTEGSTQNTDLFWKGDVIQITTKIDGANASVCYDTETKKLAAFSRNHLLTEKNTLRGFREYVKSLNADTFADTPQFIIFGEWLVNHTVVYEKDAYHSWYVYDIYDTDHQKWMPQDFVRQFAKAHGLEYVNELYRGPFESWDHVRSFLNHHWKSLGKEEGVVVKNQTRLNENGRCPYYLKIVNEEYSEVKMDPASKRKAPEKTGAAAVAEKATEQIVTEARVRKILLKLIDEGVLPEIIESTHMKTVAANLPKRVYLDCLKEEPDAVEKIGNKFGKYCGGMAMQIAMRMIMNRTYMQD